MIKKYSEMNKINEKLKNNNYFTVGDLKKLINDLPDDMSVCIVNGVSAGGNEGVRESFSVEDVYQNDEGHAYVQYDMTKPSKFYKVVKGLIIYGE